jgi:hypothetical protein
VPYEKLNFNVFILTESKHDFVRGVNVGGTIAKKKK